jgi:uncharacterized protein (DUF58 family)
MSTRERIYIVPRWAGFVFGAAVLAVFVLGYFAHGFGGLPQTLVISFVVVGIVALIQTNENLRGVVLVSCVSHPVPAGGEANLTVQFQNSSDRERLGLRVRLREGWHLVGDARIPVLRAGERVTIQLRVPTPRRGCYPHPPLWVSSDLPFGICFAWKVLESSGHMVVYPRPVGQPLDAILGGDSEAGAETRKGADDISGHRPYVSGDPLSRIDWRVFAKSSKLAVKTFENEGGHRVILRWEETAFHHDIESRLEQLSFWVSECTARRQPFQLLFGSQRRQLNETNLNACRAALAAYSL